MANIPTPRRSTASDQDWRRTTHKIYAAELTISAQTFCGLRLKSLDRVKGTARTGNATLSVTEFWMPVTCKKCKLWEPAPVSAMGPVQRFYSTGTARDGTRLYQPVSLIPTKKLRKIRRG